MRLNIPRESVTSNINGRAFEAGTHSWSQEPSSRPERRGRWKSRLGIFGDQPIQHRDRNESLEVPVHFSSKFFRIGSGVRVYLWNESTGYQANGFTPLRFGQMYFDSLRTIPESRIKGQPPFFRMDRGSTVPLQASIKVLSPIDQTLKLEPESPGSACYTTFNRIGPFPRHPGSLCRGRPESIRNDFDE